MAEQNPSQLGDDVELALKSHSASSTTVTMRCHVFCEKGLNLALIREIISI